MALTFGQFWFGVVVPLAMLFGCILALAWNHRDD